MAAILFIYKLCSKEVTHYTLLGQYLPNNALILLALLQELDHFQVKRVAFPLLLNIVITTCLTRRFKANVLRTDGMISFECTIQLGLPRLAQWNQDVIVSKC